MRPETGPAVPSRVLAIELGWRGRFGSRQRIGALDDGQPGFFEPALDHRPVPSKAVLVHRVRANDRRAIVPPHDLGASRSAEESPAHDAHAGRSHVKPPFPAIGLDLAFLEAFTFAIIHGGHRELVVEGGDP